MLSMSCTRRLLSMSKAPLNPLLKNLFCSSSITALSGPSHEARRNVFMAIKHKSGMPLMHKPTWASLMKGHCSGLFIYGLDDLAPKRCILQWFPPT
jgi:hypothetical protein